MRAARSQRFFPGRAVIGWLWMPAAASISRARRTPAIFRSLRAPFARALPAALEATSTDLSGTTGAVVDPIFAIRRSFAIEPGERVVLAFTTGVAATREEAVAVASVDGVRFEEIGPAQLKGVGRPVNLFRAVRA